MKFTLADCVEKINQVLNYPSVAYSDISYFFDQAISELNTELHIGLKPISEIYKNSTFKVEDLGDFIYLSEAPVGNLDKIYLESDETHKNDDVLLVIKNQNNANDTFDDVSVIKYRVYKDSEYKETERLFGMYARYVTDENGKPTGEIQRELYQTVTVGTWAYWTPYAIVPDVELDLTEYLAYDWIILFLIPYVCFKYAVRNGDSGALYAEEFQQGFQQLNKSYEVPSFVNLTTQAGKKAYKEDVLTNIDNLNVNIPTRAIYENMKVARVIQATYGNNMYDTGGWGV